MALSDVKVRSAKPEAKAYKLTDGEGMVLLVHPNGSKYWCHERCNSDPHPTPEIRSRG